MGFLLGWLAGILVAVVLHLLSSVLPQQDSSGSSPVSGVIKIILGALLLFPGKQWRARPSEGEQAAMPKWMSAIDSMTAIKGSGLASALGGQSEKPVAGDFGRSDHRRREPELG